MFIETKRPWAGLCCALLQKLIIVTGCIFIIYFAFVNGKAVLDAKQTDSFSEQQAIGDARSIFAGKHRFGIVEYCHFPNGPSYMLLAPLALGFDSPRDLRLVPLGFSAVCVGALFLGLALYASSILMLPLALVATVCILRQPGVLYWMGGLHEQSYALAMCFAAMGVSLIPCKLRYVLVTLGFIAGWIGYDMLIGFVFSVFTCRLLLHSRGARSVKEAFQQAVIDSVFGTLGALFAVATHLIQNAFFFGSVKAAFKDLIGSAAARAGVESAAAMNNPYWEGLKFHLQDPATASMTRKDLVIAHLRAFLSAEWTDMPSAYVCFSSLAVALGAGLLVTVFIRKWSAKDVDRIGVVVLLATCGAMLAGIGWILVMPHHARFHFHFLPRHFFVPGVLMWIVVYALLDLVLARLFKKNTVP